MKTSIVTCPKCGAHSGDDWSQCKGSCPMSGSTHHATGSPYRHVDHAARRRAAIAEARRVRDALASAPRFYNVAGSLGSSQEIVDALTACIEELAL